MNLTGAVLIVANDENGVPQALGPLNPLPVGVSNLIPYGAHVHREDLDVARVLGVPTGASLLSLQSTATGKAVRFTVDETTPTNALGQKLLGDDPPYPIPVSDDTVITVIQQDAGAAIDYQFWGPPA